MRQLCWLCGAYAFDCKYASLQCCLTCYHSILCVADSLPRFVAFVVLDIQAAQQESKLKQRAELRGQNDQSSFSASDLTALERDTVSRSHTSDALANIASRRMAARSMGDVSQLSSHSGSVPATPLLSLSRSLNSFIPVSTATPVLSHGMSSVLLTAARTPSPATSRSVSPAPGALPTSTSATSITTGSGAIQSKPPLHRPPSMPTPASHGRTYSHSAHLLVRHAHASSSPAAGVTASNSGSSLSLFPKSAPSHSRDLSISSEALRSGGATRAATVISPSLSAVSSAAGAGAAPVPAIGSHERHKSSFLPVPSAHDEPLHRRTPSEIHRTFTVAPRSSGLPVAHVRAQSAVVTPNLSSAVTRLHMPGSGGSSSSSAGIAAAVKATLLGTSPVLTGSEPLSGGVSVGGSTITGHVGPSILGSRSAVVHGRSVTSDWRGGTGSLPRSFRPSAAAAMLKMTGTSPAGGDTVAENKLSSIGEVEAARSISSGTAPAEPRHRHVNTQTLRFLIQQATPFSPQASLRNVLADIEAAGSGSDEQLSDTLASVQLEDNSGVGRGTLSLNIPDEKHVEDAVLQPAAGRSSSSTGTGKHVPTAWDSVLPGDSAQVTSQAGVYTAVSGSGQSSTRGARSVTDSWRGVSDGATPTSAYAASATVTKAPPPEGWVVVPSRPGSVSSAASSYASVRRDGTQQQYQEHHHHHHHQQQQQQQQQQGHARPPVNSSRVFEQRDSSGNIVETLTDEQLAHLANVVPARPVTAAGAVNSPPDSKAAAPSPAQFPASALLPVAATVRPSVGTTGTLSRSSSNRELAGESAAKQTLGSGSSVLISPPSAFRVSVDGVSPATSSLALNQSGRDATLISLSSGAQLRGAAPQQDAAVKGPSTPLGAASLALLKRYGSVERLATSSGAPQPQSSNSTRDRFPGLSPVSTAIAQLIPRPMASGTQIEHQQQQQHHHHTPLETVIAGPDVTGLPVLPEVHLPSQPSLLMELSFEKGYTAYEHLIPAFRGPTPYSNWAIPGRVLCGAWPGRIYARYCASFELSCLPNDRN